MDTRICEVDDNHLRVLNRVLTVYRKSTLWVNAWSEYPAHQLVACIRSKSSVSFNYFVRQLKLPSIKRRPYVYTHAVLFTYTDCFDLKKCKLQAYYCKSNTSDFCIAVKFSDEEKVIAEAVFKEVDLYGIELYIDEIEKQMLTEGLVDESKDLYLDT